MELLITYSSKKTKILDCHSKIISGASEIKIWNLETIFERFFLFPSSPLNIPPFFPISIFSTISLSHTLFLFIPDSLSPRDELTLGSGGGGAGGGGGGEGLFDRPDDFLAHTIPIPFAVFIVCCYHHIFSLFSLSYLGEKYFVFRPAIEK